MKVITPWEYQVQINWKFSNCVIYRLEPHTCIHKTLICFEVLSIFPSSRHIKSPVKDETEWQKSHFSSILLVKRGVVTCQDENSDVCSNIVKLWEVTPETIQVTRARSPIVAKDDHKSTTPIELIHKSSTLSDKAVVNISSAYNEHIERFDKFCQTQ